MSGWILFWSKIWTDFQNRVAKDIEELFGQQQSQDDKDMAADSITSSPTKRSLMAPALPLLGSSSALPPEVYEALTSVPILAANNPYNRLITAMEIAEEKRIQWFFSIKESGELYFKDILRIFQFEFVLSKCVIFVKIRVLKEFRGDYLFEFHFIIKIKAHTSKMAY